MIGAGKSHKFTIPEEEVPRWRGVEIGDPWDGDAPKQVTSRSSAIGGMPSRRPEARSGDKPAVRSSVKPSHAQNDNLIDDTCQSGDGARP